MQIIDNELPEMIAYFEDIIGKARIKHILRTGESATDKPYWYKYIKQYKRWQSRGERISDIASNHKLMEFAIKVKGINEFAQDWDKPEFRDEFLKRLADSKRAEGLLFEIRTGIHFLVQGLDIHLILDACDKKTPDLQINLENDAKVVVECVLRSPSLGRELCDSKLIDDLLKVASDKLESKYDWGCPRFVAVKIPEHIDWSAAGIRLGIEDRINRWFRQERMASVNVLYFMGKETINPRWDNRSRLRAYYPDQLVFLFRNPLARYPLPQYMNSKIAG